jgi:hypothetical protein
MPESVCLNMIQGNALGRSLLLSCIAVLQFVVVYLLHRAPRITPLARPLRLQTPSRRFTGSQKVAAFNEVVEFRAGAFL